MIKYNCIFFDDVADYITACKKFEKVFSYKFGCDDCKSFTEDKRKFQRRKSDRRKK